MKKWVGLQEVARGGGGGIPYVKCLLIRNCWQLWCAVVAVTFPASTTTIVHLLVYKLKLWWSLHTSSVAIMVEAQVGTGWSADPMSCKLSVILYWLYGCLSTAAIQRTQLSAKKWALDLKGQKYERRLYLTAAKQCSTWIELPCSTSIFCLKLKLSCYLSRRCRSGGGEWDTEASTGTLE